MRVLPLSMLRIYFNLRMGSAKVGDQYAEGQLEAIGGAHLVHTPLIGEGSPEKLWLHKAHRLVSCSCGELWFAP